MKSHDDSEDMPSSGKAKPFPWLWVGIGGGVAFLVLVGVCGIGAMILWSGGGGSSSGKVGKVWTLEEAEKATIGKSPEEVIAVLGKPDSSSVDTKGNGSMIYFDKIQNKHTQKITHLSVWFRDNRAYKAN